MNGRSISTTHSHPLPSSLPPYFLDSLSSPPSLPPSQPSFLLDALSLHAPSALLVFFSTDQCYSGTLPPPLLYKEGGREGGKEEEAEEEPVNAYGKSKRAFEREIEVSRTWHV